MVEQESNIDIDISSTAADGTEREQSLISNSGGTIITRTHYHNKPSTPTHMSDWFHAHSFTVAQKYIRVSRFSFLHSPSFVPRVSRSSSFVLRVSHFSFRPHLCLAFPVRPHLCFAFPISHSALIRASHFPFVLICASRFPFLIPPSFVPRIFRSSSFVLRVSHFSFRPHSCLAFPVRPHLCFVFPISHSAPEFSPPRPRGGATLNL